MEKWRASLALKLWIGLGWKERLALGGGLLWMLVWGPVVAAPVRAPSDNERE